MALAAAGDAGARGHPVRDARAVQPSWADAALRARGRPRRAWLDVVIALSDPNPRVAGGGADLLRRTGIAVEVGVEAAAADGRTAPC